MVEYPSVEKIVEFNLLALSFIRVKKSDSAQVLNREKIFKALELTNNCKGSLYDKAVILFKGLIQSHAFASGNRRTAFIAMKYFLIMNNQKLGVRDMPENARVMLGIRENYYSDEEIKGWLKNGKIRQFKR